MANRTNDTTGRPTKFYEVQKDLLLAAQGGNYLDTCAAFAGVSRSTLFDWLRTGARNRRILDAKPRSRMTQLDKDLADFSDAMKKAMAQTEMGHLLNIRAAGKDGAWQADAWMLERKYPNKWGRRDRIDVGLDPTTEEPEPEKAAEETLSERINDYEALFRKMETDDA